MGRQAGAAPDAAGGDHTTMIPLLRAPHAAVIAGAALSMAAGPIRASVDRVVEKVEQQRKDPCAMAMERHVPCFPTETTLEDGQVSVRRSLGLLGPPDQWSPDRPPTLEEIKDYRPHVPASHVVPVMIFVKLDPGCVGRSVIRSVQGLNDTYYLYRTRSIHGTRVAMYDGPVEASTFQGELELLGKFHGECAARAAYLRELIDTRLPPPRP